MRINTKRIRWGRIMLVSLVTLGAAVGLLSSGKLIRAWEGDYWTTEYEGLSITVVSVEQNGVSLVPQDDGEGGYYFVTANNTDAVRVGMIVDGMVSNDSYYYYPTDDWWNGRVDLTPENNGDVIYQELTPNIYFQDECHGGDCYDDPLSGSYHVGANVNRTNGYGVQKNLVLRPASIGSHSIEVVSVKQGNSDLALVDNEYQISDYSTPITLTYKLKNLEIGKNYSAEVSHVDYYSFRAEATEITATGELTLNYTNKHLNTAVNLYSTDLSEQVNIYFNVVDENFIALGDIIIDEIGQGGVALTPVADTSSWQRQYTFTVNDAQGLTVALHSTRATASMNYYISYYAYGSEASLSSREPVRVTGEELEMGAVITIPAPYGVSDSSPLTLSFTVNTTGRDAGGYGSQKVVYKNYADPQNTSDAFRLNVYEDSTIARYGAAMYYSDGTEIDGNRISPALHDATHPLLVEVRGERYDNARTYEVEATVGEAYGETFYTHVFQVTGAELNEGTVLTLEGLTLSLPEFDPSGTTSGYELAYEFSLTIDGLQLSGEMFYVYEGWINPSITFNNGDVVAMGSGGGIGGDVYTTVNAVTMRKSSLSESRGAKLNYLAGAFDDILSYDYAIYYNGNAGGDWWSTPAGTIVAEGTLTGEQLNNNGLSVNLATPSNESEGVKYTLVISRNGKIVRLAKDSIAFTTEPKIESFKFTADSDSFMQIERTAYRVASGTDILATLTGDGFTDNAEYKLWVIYEGYRYNEESQSDWPEEVDLTALNTSTIVTGAQLNAGYTYALNYVEAFDGVNFIDVAFVLTDADAVEPIWHGGASNGSYSGHTIHVDYVNDDEVFRDNGYQVNDDGTITNVSQPDGPHIEIPIDDRTPAEVTVIPEGGTLTVISETPVTVIGYRNGEWVKLFEWDVSENGNERTNHYSIGDCDEVKVVLKGDGNMDGAVSTADSNLINKSLISSSLPPYRALTDIERLILDLDGDNAISTGDSNIINKSLISPSLPPYRRIQW